MKKSPFGKLVVGMAAVLAVVFFAKESGRRSAFDVNQRESASTGVLAPVQTMVTAQDSEGVTEADLDLAGLKHIEEWIVQTALDKSRAAYSAQGYDPESFDNSSFTSSSVYIEPEGRKLAVIRMNMSGARSVTVVGIRGDELVRVLCIRPSDHDIPVMRGECGSKVRETFALARSSP